MSIRLQSEYNKILLELLNNLKKYFDLVSFVVYGSVARNESKKGSDIDILIVVEEMQDRYKAFKLFEKAENETDTGERIFFSPVIKSRKDASKITPLYLDMVEDSIILYDKGDFFKEVLERLKDRLRILKAERIRIGKMWYWNLKKDYKFGEMIEIE